MSGWRGLGSRQAIFEYMCLCRFSDRAEGWLTIEQRVLRNRLFGNGIVPGGLGYRRQRQPVAFGDPIDRHGDNRRIVGGDRAGQHTNSTGDEAAEK